MNIKTNIKLLILMLLIVLSTCAFLFFKAGSPETIPNETPEAKKLLDSLILTSKINPAEAIKELENTNNLPEYTNYKKNYVLARLYEKNEDTQKAILIYERLLNKNYPLKERALFHYARLKVAQGDDKTALRFFNKLLTEFPKSKSVPQAKYYLAQTQLRLRLTSNALDTLKSLRSQHPDSQFGIAANYYLGEYAYNKNNFGEAIQFWREYLRQSPDGRFAVGITNFVSNNNNFSLNETDHLLLGDVFFHTKEYSKAAFHYKLAKNKESYYNLAYSLFRINNKPEAVSYFRDFSHTFPKSENAKLSLYYASKCLPAFKRQTFWKELTLDLPELAYYTTYKMAQTEASKRKKEKLLEDYIYHYSDTEFTLDAVWEIMWTKITEDRNYSKAEEIGRKFFDLSKDSKINSRSETRAKIGFWLGKIYEITNKKDKAVEIYTQTKNILPDNYYCFRAGHRLLALSNKSDPSWNQQGSIEDFKTYNWYFPIITGPATLKKMYGSTVLELINLRQFDEAIDLIGKDTSPSKQITAWLKSLNNEYQESINLSSILINNHNVSSGSAIWKLAYPLYFWENIINICKNYPEVDPMLICGLIRQESRFESNALSISNARGLMQLIPPTARNVSRQANINLTSLEMLNKPNINIALGIHYFDGIIKELNNPLFAIASYNAGPHAVKRWKQSFLRKNNDLDFFVEEIPYSETKDYVKRVFGGYWTYLELYKP